MLILDDIQFFIDFAKATIPIQLKAFQFFFNTLIHLILPVDPAAKSTVPSLVSLPFGVFDKRPVKQEKACPFSNGHEYIAPGPDDSRSPCPALNTMANHGYIPRNGRELTGSILTKALMECYQLSYPLAAFLAWGGVVLLGQTGLFTLHDLARHNHIEHNASITHADTKQNEEYAPFLSHKHLMQAFLADARTVNDERDAVFGTAEIANARIRRESEAGELSAVQQEIARGEVALVLSIFGGDKFEVPIKDVVAWWKEERLPKGWQPTRKTTLLGTVGWSTAIRHTMQAKRDGTWTPDHHQTILEKIQQTSAYRHVVDLLRSAIAEVTHKKEVPEEKQIVEELNTARVIEDHSRAVAENQALDMKMLRRKSPLQNGTSNDEDHKILAATYMRHNSIPVAIAA